MWSRLPDCARLQAFGYVSDLQHVVVLSCVAQEFRSLAYNSILEHLDNPNSTNRRAALKAVVNVAEKSDPRAITAVIACLQDTDLVIRLFAVKAIVLVLSGGHRAASLALVDRLGDDSTDVRKAALDALVKITPKGDATVVAMLVQSLQRKPPGSFHEGRICELRRLYLFGVAKVVSVKALGSISHKGDQYSITALLQLLGSVGLDMIASVMKALENVTEHNDRRVISYFLTAITHGSERLYDDLFDETVRRAMVKTFTSIVPLGDLDSIRVLVEVLENDRQGQWGKERCQLVAMLMLEHVGRPGDDGLITVLIKHLDNELLPCWVLEKVFRTLAPNHNHQAITATVQGLKHAAPRVRRRALEVLRNIARKGDPIVVDAVVQCLEDGNVFVRRTAMRTLGEITQASDEHAVSAVLVCLVEEDDPEVLRVGLMVFARPAQYCSFDYYADIRHLVTRLQRHHDLDVRYAAELASDESLPYDF